MNKDLAVKKLKESLYREKYDSEMAAVNRSRSVQVGNRDRNEKIRTYNYSRNMITDHRLGESRIVQGLAGFWSGEEGYDIIHEFHDMLESKTRRVMLEELVRNVKV